MKVGKHLKGNKLDFSWYIFKCNLSKDKDYWDFYLLIYLSNDCILRAFQLHFNISVFKKYIWKREKKNG